MQNHKILWTFGSKYSRGSTLFIIKNRRQSRIIASFSVLVLFALTYAIFNPIYVEHDGAYAVTGSATAATTSLTLSTANNLASMHVVPTANGGTFASSNAADSAVFNVNTNNYTGYTLAISSDDDSGRLEGTYGYIESIDSALTTSAFDNSVNNNKWGYRPSKYMSNDAVVDNTGETAVFLPSPTTVATVLDRTTTANTANNAYTIALGARVDYSVMSGSYHKNFNLIATANPISYTINYNQNTAETVTGMPETQSSATSETNITLANNTPERASYLFLGWCNVQPTTANDIDSCAGTTFQPGGVYGIDQTTANTTTLYAMWKLNSFTQTTQVRYEDVNGNWGDYSTVETKKVAYGSSYSWSTSQIPGFNNITYQSASVPSYTVTGEKTNQVSIYRNTFTCAKQYRLENADGTWEGYISDGSETLRYGATCSYSKTVTDYKGSASGTNNSTASTSATVTSTTTLSLNLYRNTFALTLSAGDNLKSASITTAAVHGSNYFRWGQRVDLSAAQNDNNTCSTYNTPSWSRTSGVGTLSSSSSTTPYFTMAKGDATVTVRATKTDIKQTITLTRGGTGVNSIRIGSSSYSGSSASLVCGSYEVYGNYKNGYEFQSWAVSGVTLANVSSATTTMTVSGPGALTLNGKASGVSFVQAFASAGKTQTNGYYNMQDMTSAICAATRFDETISLRDNRDGEIYQVGKFSDGKCWQMENLRLGDNSTITLTPANTNITSNYTLPANLRLTTDPFYSYTEPQIDTNSKTLALSAPGASGTAIVGVYYNFCALSAGTICEENNGNELTQDICPKGWRVPTGSTSGEYAKLYSALGYANFLSILRFPFAGTAWGRGITEDDEVQIWTATPTGTLINRYFLNIVRTASGYQVKNNVSISRQEGKPIRCIAK